MAETALLPRSPLAGIAQAGRHGADGGAPGMVLEEVATLQIASLTARKERSVALAAAVRKHWGLDLPLVPRWVGDERLAFLWSGPDQWLAVSESWPGALDTGVRNALSGLASVTAQGDGRMVVRIAGPRTRDVLAKGMAVDLHPRVFGPGDTAVTQFAHVGVQIRQLDATPSYELLAFRSHTATLYRALLSAGAEYGVDVVVRG